jgi:hypothetical protein
MTFLHHEWDGGVLTLEGGWDVSNDRTASLAMARTNPTRPSKKISLSEYNKMRSKSAASSSAEDQPNVKAKERAHAAARAKESSESKKGLMPEGEDKSQRSGTSEPVEQRGQKR